MKRRTPYSTNTCCCRANRQQPAASSFFHRLSIVHHEALPRGLNEIVSLVVSTRSGQTHKPHDNALTNRTCPKSVQAKIRSAFRNHLTTRTREQLTNLLSLLLPHQSLTLQLNLLNLLLSLLQQFLRRLQLLHHLNRFWLKDRLPMLVEEKIV